MHPKPLLSVLDYPLSIEKFSLRKHERVDTIIPAVISESASDQKGHGAILNISASGAMVALEPANGYSVGQKILLSCTLPDGSGVMELHSSIKNLKPQAEKILMGVCYSDGHVESFNTMRAFYEHCFRYAKGKTPCLK